MRWEAALSTLCKGRSVIVTGAGRGLGRAHALALASAGARVVVNDLGVAPDGAGHSRSPADEVVEEIRAAGGEAVANADDVAEWTASGHIVEAALESFGGLDAVVNNAGFVRDRMFVSTSEEEWDAVVRVHLKGHFCVSRHASEYWRSRSKAGQPLAARIINTTSGAGLQGSIGQSSYSAAKAAIAALTLVQAAELGRYGVTANAIAPAARTRMTEAIFTEMAAPTDGSFDENAPENVSPLVVWLASEESGEVTGRVFEIRGGSLGISDGWRDGPTIDHGARFEPDEIGTAMAELLERAQVAQKVFGT